MNQYALKERHFASLETENSTKYFSQIEKHVYKTRFRDIIFSLFGLDTFNYWWLYLFQNPITTDNAFYFSATHFQLFTWNSCPATHAVINNSCFFHISYLFVQRKSILLLNVSSVDPVNEG